jgi:acetyltransferase-like isoleucine patch superfamily enzyme
MHRTDNMSVSRGHISKVSKLPTNLFGKLLRRLLTSLRKTLEIVKAFLFAIKHVRSFFLTYMPGNTGVRWRYWYYQKRFKECGKNVIIGQGVIIDGAENISIGDNVHIDKYCVIEAGRAKITNRRKIKSHNDHRITEGELIIGNNIHIVDFCMIVAHGGVLISDNCTLSAGTKIYSISNLAYDPDNRGKRISIMPYDQAFFFVAPVILEQNVWVGLNGIIMPGVCIGRDSFVASNSLVINSYPENSYIVGQPAKRIRERFITVL